MDLRCQVPCDNVQKGCGCGQSRSLALRTSVTCSFWTRRGQMHCKNRHKST